MAATGKSIFTGLSGEFALVKGTLLWWDEDGIFGVSTDEDNPVKEYIYPDIRQKRISVQEWRWYKADAKKRNEIGKEDIRKLEQMLDEMNRRGYRVFQGPII